MFNSVVLQADATDVVEINFVMLQADAEEINYHLCQLLILLQYAVDNWFLATQTCSNLSILP